jgi:4,5-dihydroxyphthalate decarboxylase
LCISQIHIETNNNMNPIPLSLCIGPYDHTRDLTEGQVSVPGVKLTTFSLPIEETFYRFLHHREWDVSELSFGKYVSLRAAGDTSLIALPVFPSRVFRLSSIYVRRDHQARFADLAQLKGARIGVPEWAQTAAVYTRGYLQHEARVPLESVQWTQAGVNEAGRKEKVALSLPEGLKLTARADASLNDLLIAGELDAIFSARPPKGLTAPAGGGEAPLVRLLPNSRAMEAAHFDKTGIFPIMHAIVVRQEVLDQNPWIAMNLMQAFEEAKANAIERVADITASHTPLPWVSDLMRESHARFGTDPFPYGVDANRATLTAFCKFAFEQGVAKRLMQPEELFAKTVLGRHRV